MAIINRLCIRRVCIAAGLLFAVTAQAQESFFMVDGLAVDTLDKDLDAPYFRAELPRFPLSDISKIGLDMSALEVPDLGRESLQENRAKRHLRAANFYMDKKEWRKALLELHDVLVFEPDNATVFRLIAAVSSILKDYATAELYFGKYLERFPADTSYMAAFANVLIRQGKTEKAETILGEWLASGEEPNLMYWFNTALLRLLKEQGLENMAIWSRMNLFQMAVIAGWITADMEELRTILGPARFSALCRVAAHTQYPDRIDDMAEALKDYQLHKRSQEWAKARQDLETIRKLGLENFHWQIQFAVMNGRLGQLDAALKQLRDLLTEYPDVDILWYHYGIALSDAKKHEEAAKAFYRAYSIDPNSALYRYSLAGSYAIQQKTSDAWTLMLSIAEDKPDRLAEWLQEPGQFRDALSRDIRYPDLCRRLGIPPELE